MMHAILEFFSNLILFTAGLAVLVFWIVALIAVAIEGYDLFHPDVDMEGEDN